jgi:spore coat polysaccharide biosynthesis protein SpsF
VATRLGYPVTRGSETDVLARFADAARASDADVILRITSDCPLLDPDESSRVLEAFLAAKPDYAANVLDRRLPRGLDTEVVTRDALERAHREATDPREREHVTLHLYQNPARFRLLSVVSDRAEDLSSFRWTLDTLEDYRFLHAVFELLGARADLARTEGVLKALREHPDLSQINAHVAQKKA